MRIVRGLLPVVLLTFAGLGRAGETAPLVATLSLAPTRYEVTLPEKVGVLKAVEHRVLAFEVPGRLEWLAVEGEVVAEADEVARLDSALERAQLRQAELQLREARSELARAQGLKRSQAASDKALEVAETAVGVRVAERDAARERVERRRLLAHFDGVIAETRAEPGEVVAAGTPVATLMDTSALRLEVGVPGYQVGRVAREARALVTVSAFPGEKFEGVVHKVARAAAEGRHLFEVELRIPNPAGRLRPGMGARARIVTQILEDALVVPFETVVERDGARVVFFVADGRAHAIVVSEAPLHGDLLLLNGDLVFRELVVRGQRHLRDGSRVRVNNAILSDATLP